MIIPVLNYQEEEVCLQKMKKDAQTNCKELLGKLVACTKTKTITLYWPWSACEMQRLASSECLAQFTTPEVKEGIREAVLTDKIRYLKAKHGINVE
jgi:Cytochrome c oxidase biogenesis protein Cmc1 like